MQDLPDIEPGEKFSLTVIVYDKSDGLADLGYYDFEKKQWFILGDFSMQLICWCYIPDPKKFIADNKLTSVLHNGYRP